MRPRVLITGASGFVGYHLISAAIEAGMEVHAAVRSTGKISQLQHFNLRYVIPDYTDQDSLCELLEQYQYSYIIHAAGITRAESDGNSYERYALGNISKWVLGVHMLRIHIPTPIMKFVATVLEKLSKGIPLMNKEKLLELNAQNRNCNIEQIRTDLGFNPVYNLERGMEETLNWYTTNKWF